LFKLIKFLHHHFNKMFSNTLFNMKKAQVANEFLILLCMSFLFLLIFMYASAEDIQFLIQKKEFNAINDMGFFVQSEIFQAASVYDGYYREFEVPKTHYGVNYSITISGNFLLIKSTHTGQLLEFRITNVTGNVQKGMNNITKLGGVIYLN
jgi:hypothetical protein